MSDSVFIKTGDAEIGTINLNDGTYLRIVDLISAYKIMYNNIHIPEVKEFIKIQIENLTKLILE